MNNDTELNEKNNRTVAIVSGKGGSGKTMVTTVIARVLSHAKQEVIIIDADTGTAGMTYYLGLKLVKNIRVGLSTLANKGHIDEDLIRRAIQKIKGFEKSEFIGIGDHRRLEREIPEEALPNILRELIDNLYEFKAWKIVDCRGGIDRESIAVCQSADDVILVIESDTTSFQATKHVVDILSDHELAHKIRGFFINKVFNDPSEIIKNGTSFFGTQFLSAIPFDISATRAFLIGESPSLDSLFGTHIWQGVYKAYPEVVQEPDKRIWTNEEYREVGLSNLESVRGGLVMAGCIILATILFFFARYIDSGNSNLSRPFGPATVEIVVLYVAIFGLIGSIENTRRIIGRLISIYFRALSRILYKK
jgi:flagellar biosynthesis protein FlhG